VRPVTLVVLAVLALRSNLVLAVPVAPEAKWSLIS
jgi:hypothetical protein